MLIGILNFNTSIPKRRLKFGGVYLRDSKPSCTEQTILFLIPFQT